MADELNGKKVAILVANGFEEVEMTEPRQALDKAGAQTVLVSPVQGEVKAWAHTDWGGSYRVDQSLEGATPENFDALLLPGGVLNPDKLRMNDKAVRFVKAFYDSGKPIAAICHGPWTLINAGAVQGHRMTSYESIRLDLENAGAEWVDEPVVTDHGLVTSRKPDDIPAFNKKMIEEFREGVHESRRAERIQVQDTVAGNR